MSKVLGFVLTVSLFLNIVFFVKWRKIRRFSMLIGAGSVAELPNYMANSDNLKIVEPTAVTQSIGDLQVQWRKAVLPKRRFKNLADSDFPEDSPILI